LNNWKYNVCYELHKTCTKSDIVYSVSKLNRFTSNLSMYNWIAIKRVFKYLRYILDYGLYYIAYLVILEGYSNVNWIFDTKNSKSTSGYIFILDGAIMSWKFSKQICIARSKMKSKFITLDKAREEARWLWNFSENIPYWPKPVSTIYIQRDISLQLKGHKVVRITGSLHIYVVDIISLNICSQMKLFSLTM
jgi:hypothetical protein